MKNWLKRYAFLLLLAAVLVGGETVLNLTDPVSRMTCIWRNDYELIRLQHPDMTFEKAIFGSSAVTASYIEGREGSVGYANIGMDYGTVKDITEMLEKGELTVTEDLVLGLNNLSFLDTLPTNATYPWHRKWYEPYLYFQRDRLEQLVTDGVTNLLNGEPFTKVDSSHQQRAVYRGALSDEDLMESWESLVERFGETTPEVDCAENFAALDRLAAWCEDHGVRLRASAPSIHMMRADIQTEVSPIVGSERQSEELVMGLLKDFEEDPSKIWESNIFGKSLHALVNEGLRAKLGRMPQDARLKLSETIERIINDGCNGLLCLIL